MDIHNTSEDIVFTSVDTIFKEIEKNNTEKFCLCEQCRVDTICYALNRVDPHYIVSNRGFTRLEQTGMKRQQIEADVSAIVYKGLRMVNHNLRPTAPHNGLPVHQNKVNLPVFDIPTIAGRIFDGCSFEPIVGVDVFLYYEGDLIIMRNNNWQNPFTMVSSTPGAFSFWPAPISAENAGIEKEFKFSLKVHSPDYEILNHFFSITTTSKYHSPDSYALNRTFKLPDLYIFPPGEAEING
jgi:competence protein ComFB